MIVRRLLTSFQKLRLQQLLLSRHQEPVKALKPRQTHPLQDVDAVLQPGVLLSKLLQTCRRVQVLWVLQTLDLGRESLDLPLLTNGEQNEEVSV